MKSKKATQLKIALLTLLIVALGCERDISDDAMVAGFATTAEIFTDDFIGMGEDFYLPFADSKLDAFSVDDTEGYESNASYRIDVPNASDPLGSYAGAILRIDGAGRDLSKYDALTFWAKASTGVSLNEVGYGIDFLDNKYQVTTRNLNVGTNWAKYTIPIADASKLIEERGVFWYSTGTQNTGGTGYILWLDDLKFEKLGTIAQPRPEILGGEDLFDESFIGSDITIDGLTQTFNLESGVNQTVSAAPLYFTFESSDTNVAVVNELGVVSIIAEGTTTITASLDGIQANGSLEITAGGSFVNAPDPTLPQADVTSIYSDFYTGVTGFNPGVFAGSNTQSISVQSFDGNSHVNYEGIDFIGIGWDNTVNVSGETMVHLDVQLTGGSNLTLELIDFGPDDIDNGFGGSDGTAGGNNISSQLVQDQWVSIDIPLSAFTLSTGGGGSGNPNLSNIGFIVFVSSDGASFLVDNIYFY